MAGPVRSSYPSNPSLSTHGIRLIPCSHNRGLDFTAVALSQNISSTEELSASFRNAYGSTLKPHHSFMVKPIFSAAMSACPYRVDFYKKLGVDENMVKEQLKVWLAALERLIVILKAFLDRKEAKW